ncbi:hypothetical protein [Pseudotabrizicola algicola]|uniref:Uncharacterized protein n=1 Tax=Pseudotabrizicola algicola TaxID=2709381 RepID=A0A6B3RWU7_9RHOB|nr:hypothetical protein [Pseudotabrizicola algicola]NEX47602.1 hypothetical protein [Pseudotabrizicola algicola]
MTGKTNAPLPDAGGSYIRDPKTGAIQVVEAASDAPAPDAGKPAIKPVKQPVKEA